MSDRLTSTCSQRVFHNQDLHVIDQEQTSQHWSSNTMSSPFKWLSNCTENTNLVMPEEALSNGTCEVETMVTLHCPSDCGDVTVEGDNLALSNDGMSEFSNSDLSLPEVCISTNSNSFEDEMNYEVQQAYRIFTGFLLDKHKGITSPFLHPIGYQEAQHGIGGVRSWAQGQLKQSMCLQRMEEKFINQEYETITEFVADFRLMLENCYRYHGVDHWISKQAQKLEIMLEQKLTLLSRTLREKTTLAVTSKGRFGTEEERSSGGTSTRRRLAPRSLATITVGGHESVMVQALRLEEQQRVKDEKRQRELEKKEAEEMSAKEVDEWEQSLLSQASLHTIDTLWELPAIGHFLCLAQTALNLPEIVFFELERCLLMPRCSLLLSKIMSSLLSPPQRRATLHRRPALPYRRWESELRQRVMLWYRAVGSSRDQPGRAEQLGLCHQYFRVLGEVCPLVEKPFHLLPFYQRVWLLKGLCDHVYETQKDVQDALLSQPIHECRESILGYDSKENAYIHFPHFCGADLRIYCQSPGTPPAFPFPSLLVKRVEKEPVSEGEESDGIKDEGVKSDRETMDTRDYGDFGNGGVVTQGHFNGEEEEDKKMIESWSQKEEGSEPVSSDADSCEDSKLNLNLSPSSLVHRGPIRERGVKTNLGEKTVMSEHHSKKCMLQQEQAFTLGSVRTIKAETKEPCLSVGEHSYMGRSPARIVNLPSPDKAVRLKMEGEETSQNHQRPSCVECFESKTSNFKSENNNCFCGCSRAQLSSESAQNSSEERPNDKLWTKKQKRKKKRGREQLPRVKGEHKQLQRADRMRLSPAETAKSAVRRVATTIKRKDKKKKHKMDKKLDSSKKVKDEPPVEPSFKLVCTSLEELRELISKTEDELDDLESSKKRLGRWYFRREAVKELHSTLIRLLNELSPWEPKLIKAYQRNRLRLKKEFDDFKNHPEYNNFVREECISSSSDDDDDDDDEEKGFGKEVCLLPDQYRRSEDEDLEHMVPRGLWSGASTREFTAETAEERTLTYVTTNDPKHSLDATEKGFGLLQRVQTSMNRITSNPESGSQCRSELIPLNQSRDLNSAWTAKLPAQDSLSPRPLILHPTIGLPKGYTPIPTLLAKSVGNKVTLMKRPTDCPWMNTVEKQRKESSVSMPTSTVTTTNLSKAQSNPCSSQRNLQHKLAHGLEQKEELRPTGMAIVKAAPPTSLQAKTTQTVPKNSVQVVYKVPERLGHLVQKDSSSQVKISVHSVVDQNTGEKTMQQVVILPSNLLIQSTEEKGSSSDQQTCKGIQVPVSKPAGALCMSTNVPGFTIPENRIPVQQVAPLKDSRTLSTPSPSVSPCLQQRTPNIVGLKVSQVSGSEASTTQVVPPKTSAITTQSSAFSSEPFKSTAPKQELKTVCIRDSQSILVTTRGGNTGIVKVQSSSDKNVLGSLPATPVITISPQFKAFLVSKTSQTPPSILSHSSSGNIPATTSVTVGQPQKHVPSVLKSPSTVTTPRLPEVTGCVHLTGSEGQTEGTTVAQSKGTNTSVGSFAANIGQQIVSAIGSNFQTPLVKDTVVVPSLSSSGHPQVLSQAEMISKTGKKRPSTDESSPVAKFILVSPPSSAASSVGMSKSTLPSTKPSPGSRVMFISPPTIGSSIPYGGSITKQATGTGASGPLLTTSLSSQTLKMGLSPGQPVSGNNSEALPKVKNLALPSGVQIQLTGRTTTIGQTIGVLSRSPSKSKPVPSNLGCLTATSTGLVLTSSSNTVTCCSAQLSSHTLLTTSSQVEGIPSFPAISQSSSSTSTVASLSAGKMTKKDIGINQNILSSNSSAQVTPTVQSSPSKTSVPTVVCQPSTSVLNKTETPNSSVTTTTTPIPTSAGTIQQRIVINTSTPLAAGTQILLNNARFVVPPQGLGPGSHVLIISSPTPQQVPAASTPKTAASVPPPGASSLTLAPRAPLLPQSLARLPGAPAVNSPFVACTPALGPSLLVSTPNITPVRLKSLEAAFVPSKTNVVSALPRLPASQVGNFASPPAGAPTLVSSTPKLVHVPVCPVASTAPVLNSALTTIRLTAGTTTQAECASTISPTVAPTFSRLSGPLSPFPFLPSLAPVTSPCPVKTVPSALSSTAAPEGKLALQCSGPGQQIVSGVTTVPKIQSQHTGSGITEHSTSITQALVHTGQGNMALKKTFPAVMQPVLAGVRTQVLPTVAVPPIVSTLSRMQTLPIATVPPIGSTVNTFETPPVVPTPSSSSTVIISPAQPSASLNPNNGIRPPVVLTNQALGKHPQQTSSLGIHTSPVSKLLISPDGAVLSTVQCQVNPAGLTTCPKQMDALAVSPNRSTGALLTHDSSLQTSQADGNTEIN